MYGMPDWLWKFMYVWAMIGAVVTFIGMPIGAIYGIWWAFHHVRFIP